MSHEGKGHCSSGNHRGSPADSVGFHVRRVAEGLYRYVVQGSEKQQEAHDRLLQSSVDLARENLKAELEKLNELRQQFTKDRGEFALKTSLDERFKSVDKEISELKERQTTTETRAATWMSAIGLVFLVLQLALNYRSRKKENKKREVV